jgi:NAD(P)-dependent dehydrogenase (short-subunit alcohol dehydrogenase family)
VLINNAAIYAGLERKSFTEIEEDVWDKVMAVNVKGVWQMTRAVTPLMKGAGAGAIVNVASATVFSGSPQWMHYVASKGAVIAMTRSLARELGDDNIRANVIAPGFTLTEASLDLIEDAETYGVTRGALKRSADAKDMVGSALYLASDLAGFVTGQTLIVDGGRQFI